MKNKYVADINLRQFISRDLDPRGSNIWNGIMRTKSIAFEKAKWKLGNGENINFWHDDWLRQGPLWNIEPFNRWDNSCMERFGCKVSDYRDNNEWVNLIEISLELKSLMDMVRHIPLSHNKDAII